MPVSGNGIVEFGILHCSSFDVAFLGAVTTVGVETVNPLPQILNVATLSAHVRTHICCLLTDRPLHSMSYDLFGQQ